MAFSTKYVEFGGTDEFVNAGNVLDFTQATSFSVSFWVKAPTLGGPFAIISKTGGPSPQGWSIYLTGSRQLSFRLVYSYSPDDWYGAEVTTAGFSADVWHHCIVAYDSTLGPTMYVDGVLQTAPVSHSTLATSISNAYNLTLGRMYNSGTPFYLEGSLDEVAVYDKPLNSTEVTWIYNSGEARDLLDGAAPSNLVAWWRMGEGDTFPTLQDSSVSGFDGTMTLMEAGDIKDFPVVHDATAALLADSVLSESSVLWKWATAGLLANSVTDAPVVVPAVYPDVKDFGPNGYDGTMMAGLGPSAIDTVNAGGVSTHSIHWAADVNAYIDCGDVCNFSLSDAFSVSLWVRQAAQDVNSRVLITHADPTTYFDWHIRTNGSGGIFFRFDTTTYEFLQAAGTSIMDDAWHHVVATYDGSGNQNGMLLYVDNVPQATPASKTVGGDIQIAGKLYLSNPSPWWHFLGYLDEVAIYAKELSAGEVATIYNGGAPADVNLSGIPNLEAYWRLGETLVGSLDVGVNYALASTPLADSLKTANATEILGATSICGAEALCSSDVGVNYALDAGILGDSLELCSAGVNYVIDSGILAGSDQTAWVFQEVTLVAGCMADSLCSGDVVLGYSCWAQLNGESGITCPGFDKTHQNLPAPNPSVAAPPVVRYVPPVPPAPSYGLGSGAVRTTAPIVQTPIRQPRRR